PLDSSGHAGGLAASQIAAIEDRFEDGSRSRRQTAEADILVRPHQHARPQTIWLNQALHEGNLINAGLEKKSGEVHQRLFAQMAAAIEIVAPDTIAIGQM